MIKFFRKIRYDLMSQNRPGKYLKYAIGEIFLVVIGILIALQINNWNEDRKTHRSEIKYLNQLRADLKADSIFFESRLNGIQKQAQLLQNLREMCADSLEESERNKLIDVGIHPFGRFALQSKVINDELDLKKVSDDVIRNLLRQYRTRYEYVKASGNSHNDMARENWKKMSIHNSAIIEINPDETTLSHLQLSCDYPNIEAIIVLQSRMSTIFSMNIEPFIKINADLAGEIDRYIEENQ